MKPPTKSRLLYQICIKQNCDTLVLKAKSNRSNRATVKFHFHNLHLMFLRRFSFSFGNYEEWDIDLISRAFASPISCWFKKNWKETVFFLVDYILYKVPKGVQVTIFLTMIESKPEYRYRLLKCNKGCYGDTCGVCMKNYEDGVKTVLPCSHGFHRRCLQLLFEKNKFGCPICGEMLLWSLTKDRLKRIKPPMHESQRLVNKVTKATESRLLLEIMLFHTHESMHLKAESNSSNHATIKFNFFGFPEGVPMDNSKTMGHFTLKFEKYEEWNRDLLSPTFALPVSSRFDANWEETLFSLMDYIFYKVSKGIQVSIHLVRLCGRVEVPNMLLKRVEGCYDDTCVVCMENYEGGVKTVLPCSHGFHSRCIQLLMEKDNRDCPICRQMLLWFFPTNHLKSMKPNTQLELYTLSVKEEETDTCSISEDDCGSESD